MALIATSEIIVKNKTVVVPANGNLIITAEKNSIKIKFNTDIWSLMDSKEICLLIEGNYSQIPIINDIITIPSSIINAYKNKILYIGVRGKTQDNSIIYPTPYSKLGLIR